MNTAEVIADFICRTGDDDVPERDRQAVQRSCFDAVGTLVLGSTSPQGKLVERLALAQGSRAQATVLGSGGRVSADLAALVNGTFAHADDFDDMGGCGHPSAPLLAALLAASEVAADVTGRDFVTAHAVGFEVGTSLFREVRYDQYDRCFHSTALFGAICGTAAVARLLRLDYGQTVRALSLLASQAGGVGRNIGTMIKPLHAGLGASNAVNSALLARAGVSGSAEAFDAPGGFIDAYFQNRVMTPAKLEASLGRPFKAGTALAIKKYPCCGSNHSALDGIRLIMDAESLSYDDISEVVVRAMPDTMPVLRYPTPKRGLNGKFSIRYTVGTMIRTGRIDADSFSDAAVLDPESVRAMAKVRVEIMARWDERSGGVKDHGGNPVLIRTRDGRDLEVHVARRDMRGGSSNPLSDAELETKFRGNAARRFVSQHKVDEVTAAWQRLDDDRSIPERISATCEDSTADAELAGVVR